MPFNTYLFILIIMPLTVVGYFILNKFNATIAMRFLVIISLFFYGYSGIQPLMWLMISMIINYSIVLMLRKGIFNKKIVLFVGIVFNIAVLFYFKYFNFVITSINQLFQKTFSLKNILLPLGISFITFQQIGYLVDSYREKNQSYTMLDYILYVTYFPKILMGPIVKAEEFIPQLHDSKKKIINKVSLVKGIRMFNIGLFKKVVFADTFARAVEWGFGDIAATTSMDLILVMFAYTFQIYFDFSGYSDMAIGVSTMLNIELPMNFDSPYKAYSIRDFWKRWHMSLTKFLTEYIYFPLGGSRKGKYRTYVNTMIVFLISGIWHGASWTFIFWGILHGMLQVFDRLTERFRKNIHPAMQWMTTFGTVSILWLLFRANSITEWMTMMQHIFTFNNMAVSDGLINSFILPETKFLTYLTHTSVLSELVRGFPMLLFYVMALVVCLCFENTFKRKYDDSVISSVVSAAMSVFCLTCLSSEAVFVYFNF